MGFKVTKEDLKKSQLCPVGMHRAAIVLVESAYYKDNGTQVQKVDFETEEGYTISVWFNDKFMRSLLDYIQAADNVVLNAADMDDLDIDLTDYIGKPIVIEISHQKDQKGKMQANVDNFYSADKVPF